MPPGRRNASFADAAVQANGVATAGASTQRRGRYTAGQVAGTSSPNGVVAIRAIRSLQAAVNAHTATVRLPDGQASAK